VFGVENLVLDWSAPMTTIIRVNREKCAGARCWALAPAIFELDDEGYVRPATSPCPPGKSHWQAAPRACPNAR
jgi:ferredoxin